ncbi:MAG: ABC transporter permease [Heliobacteriaceae bacterium]|jgi:phospholipid/cholesterol/gamma-HCH transport system permease protein|nr:ABC transporter permease [Heliobacteriaceae bacterium]
MITLKQYYRQSATYKILRGMLRQFGSFLDTLGKITRNGIETAKYIFHGQIRWNEVIEQCRRFGISSLPITLSIVSMTTIIVSSQVANEMVKQGGGSFVGMLLTILIVRELGVIMSGFAIISMIGSSLASEIATMRVTEQIDAIEVLKVNPIQYLFVPRVLSGIIMMPVVLIIASVVGVLAGAVSSNLASGLSYISYFDSMWLGIYMKDLFVSILKAVCFGGTIALISCSCGYYASGGAKGVGQATTKAVVWSFVAIVIWDMFFAIAFFF